MGKSKSPLSLVVKGNFSENGDNIGRISHTLSKFADLERTAVRYSKKRR